MGREQEAPIREKLTHQSVDYQFRSTHKGETCSNCSMFIEAMLPRCTIVLRPIQRGGWCRKWDPKRQPTLDPKRNQWP
jgi:hypothetical protein